MKKLFYLTMLLIVIMVVGCSSGPNYKITMTKPIYFVNNKEIPFEINVAENNKAIKGLKVSVEISMTNMDHGTYNVKLTDLGNGKYAGKVSLPMDGKYELDYTLKKGSQSSKEVINYTVKKPAGVASINGNWIKQKDLDFYAFTNKLDLAVKRDEAKKKFSGKELEDELSDLNSQEKTISNENQLLTQVIQARAISLLSTEKGHHATADEINQAIAKLKGQYDQSSSAKQLIQQFGEEKFWNLEKQQCTDVILNEKVQQDVIAQVKKDNPKANSQEVQYDAEQNFDDLLVSQMSSLKIQIL